ATRSAVATSARSAAPDSLMPQAIPDATNPGAAVTLTPSPSLSRNPRPASLSRQRTSRVQPDKRETGGLVEAEGEVGALDGLPGSALHQVVECGDHHHPASARIEPGGEVGTVGTERGLGGRRAFVDDDEGLVRVEVAQHGQGVGAADRAGVAG